MNKATLRRGAATYSTPHSRAITSPVLTSVRGWKLVEFYAKPLNAAEIFNAYPRRLVGEIRTQHRTTADRRRNSEKRHHLKSGIRVQVGRLAHVVERHVKWSQRATTLIRTVPAGRGAGSEAALAGRSSIIPDPAPGPGRSTGRPRPGEVHLVGFDQGQAQLFRLRAPFGCGRGATAASGCSGGRGCRHSSRWRPGRWSFDWWGASRGAGSLYLG